MQRKEVFINISKIQTFPLEAWQRTRGGLEMVGKVLVRVKKALFVLNLNETEQVRVRRAVELEERLSLE